MVQNRALIYKQVPKGLPKAGQDLVIESTDFDPSQSPPAGGATVKLNYISFDPYQRGRMRSPEIKSYAPPFTLGAPITNRAIATVLQSDSPNLSAGDVVTIELADNVEYAALSKEKVDAAVKPLPNPYGLDPKLFLGALGMPGLTAYSSLYAIGQPKRGETIFVSAASGAVGQAVGQIAKHEGLRVIGSVGDDEKLAFIRELGFEGFNYKTERPAEALKRLAPEGVDIYYENVGGETLEAAIGAMKLKGRIVVCGMISQYNTAPDQQFGVKNLMQFIAKRLTMRGFIVGDEDMGPVYGKEFQEKVQRWIKDGEYKPRMSVTYGFENAIEGLLSLFSGKNFGKAILEVAPLEQK